MLKPTVRISIGRASSSSRSKPSNSRRLSMGTALSSRAMASKQVQAVLTCRLRGAWQLVSPAPSTAGCAGQYGQQVYQATAQPQAQVQAQPQTSVAQYGSGQYAANAVKPGYAVSSKLVAGLAHMIPASA